jgi:glutaredoxin-related protein
VLGFSSHAALSTESCEQLEALANQYASVSLTSEQKELKRKMVVWYSTHCARQARR